MGLDNPTHIAFVLVLLLLVFGARRLPEMGRSLGSALRGFKDSLVGESPERALPERAQATVEAETATSVAQDAGARSRDNAGGA